MFRKQCSWPNCFRFLRRHNLVGYCGYHNYQRDKIRRNNPGVKAKDFFKARLEDVLFIQEDNGYINRKMFIERFKVSKRSWERFMNNLRKWKIPYSRDNEFNIIVNYDIPRY